MIVMGVVGLHPRHALYAGFLGGFSCYLATLNWLANLFGAAMVPLSAILAAFIGVLGLLTTWLHRRLLKVPLCAIAPVVWVAIEWYRSERFVLRFGWIAPGYGVIRMPAFQALASVVGSYGITLVIMGLACGVLCLWPKRKPAASLLGMVWITAAIVTGSSPAPSRPLRVRLVQANC